jgi:hypothetical protein
MTDMRMQNLRPHLIVGVLVSGMLAACGGGGGDGPPPITVSVAPRVEAASAGSDITVANYRAFAPALAQTVLTGTESSFIGAEVGYGASPTAATPLRRLGAGLFGGTPGRKTALDGCTGSGCTTPCPYGGSAVEVDNDSNGNGAWDPGESWSLTFSNCGLAPTMIVDGKVEYVLNRGEFDADGSPTAADVSATFTNMTENTLATLNGAFRFVEKECNEGLCGHKRISFSDATATHAGQTVVLRLDVLQEHGLAPTTEISGALGVGGQFYSLKPMTGERFVIPSTGALPNSGRMQMQDAAGDALEIKSQSAGLVDFLFYPNGSSTASDTWLNQPWSSFQ